MMGDVGMGVYPKGSNPTDNNMIDFGNYESMAEALNDLINYDIPRGRYGIFQDGTKVTTITQAKKLLKQHKGD